MIYEYVLWLEGTLMQTGMLGIKKIRPVTLYTMLHRSTLRKQTGDHAFLAVSYQIEPDKANMIICYVILNKALATG